MKYLGLDIGTTTICGVVLNEELEVIKSITKDNASEIKSNKSFERIQDPEITFNIVKNIADELIDEFDDIVSIGVSGQMHGIVYYDVNGKALSPLYYWQDSRALEDDNGKTYLEELKSLSGMNISSGYGGASHFYNVKNNLVPSNTKALCTIGDYVVMRLCGNKEALVHSSQAASIGLYDLKELCFKKDAIINAHLDYSLFPHTTKTNDIAGKYRDIDVIVSIGDNQASFLGSKTKDDEILVNVGTGSQISTSSKYVECRDGVELRPLNNDDYILVGAAVCGGKSYAILKNFFIETAKLLNASIEDMYDVMNKASKDGRDSLKVDTKFLGTRTNPNIRGSINNIDALNFTPSNLISGFNYGMANELFELYELMGKPNKNRLIGSGNGCRYNEGLVKAFKEIFNKDIVISSCKEEAASGAAIFSRK